MLLVFNPRRRADVCTAIECDFVKPFRDANDEPISEQQFDQELDIALNDTKLDFATVRSMLYEEMLFFHPMLKEQTVQDRGSVPDQALQVCFNCSVCSACCGLRMVWTGYYLQG